VSKFSVNQELNVTVQIKQSIWQLEQIGEDEDVHLGFKGFLDRLNLTGKLFEVVQGPDQLDHRQQEDSYVYNVVHGERGQVGDVVVQHREKAVVFLFDRMHMLNT
jgi:hypothetical protein